MRLHEDILQLRKSSLWKHLEEIGSARQENLIEGLIKSGLESTDPRVRIMAQHVLTSRAVWGELAAIEAQAEAILSENKPSEGMRSEFEYDAP